MLPDRVSNPGPMTYESGALPTALRGSAKPNKHLFSKQVLIQLPILKSEVTAILPFFYFQL